MQLPIRKAGNLPTPQFDPHITYEKLLELQRQLTKAKNALPLTIEEVKRLALMGDFSENVAYGMAKGRLRGLHQKIAELEAKIKKAIIIELNPQIDLVRLGHTVTVESNGKEKVFRVLGSAETNPTTGVISRNSPLGQALLGRSLGEVIEIKLANNKTVKYKIIKIE